MFDGMLKVAPCTDAQMVISPNFFGFGNEITPNEGGDKYKYF